MYMLGRMNGFASVLKFQKRNFQILWKVEIQDIGNTLYAGTTATNDSSTHMTEILSAIQPEKSAFLYCAGYAFRDSTNEESKRYAVVFKMDQEGDIKFLYKWGQYTELEDEAEHSQTADDVARAIAFDDITKDIVVLLEVTS